MYKNWEPVNYGQLSEDASTTIQPEEFMSYSNDVVFGCSAGHPAEIISVLTEEITTLTSLVNECKLKYMCYISDYFEEAICQTNTFCELFARNKKKKKKKSILLACLLGPLDLDNKLRMQLFLTDQMLEAHSLGVVKINFFQFQKTEILLS